MNDAVQSVLAVRMPQVNVNDEEVTLVNWLVIDGGQVAEGLPLCEVETSKAVGEVPSPAGGVLKQAAVVGEVIAIGQVFAHIGPSLEAIDAFLSAGDISAVNSEAPGLVRPQTTGEIEASAGAIELARRYGIDLSSIPATAKIRRTDVEQYISERGLTVPAAKVDSVRGTPHLPAALADKVADQGPLPPHLKSIGEHLARTQSQVVVAHVVMDVSAQGAVEWIESRRKSGMMTGPIPILLHGAAAAIAAEPKLRQFRLGGQIYSYRDADVAFTARSGDGRLFTPVVRHVDGLSLDELAKECGRLGMAVFRGRLEPAEMSGGYMTVSVLSDHPVRFHIGLQNACQSVLITAGAIREELRMIEGRPVSVPVMTLAMSYDHGLMDGWEAAAALNAAKACIEAIRP